MGYLDVNQQRIVAQVAVLNAIGFAHKVLVMGWRPLPRQADSQHSALHRERPYAWVALVLALDECVLHRCAFTKYAVAFSSHTHEFSRAGRLM